MRRVFAIASLCSILGLAACAVGTTGGNAEQTALTKLGASSTTASTIVADANLGATLVCKLDGSLTAVQNVSVLGASAPAVATACNTVVPGSVPTAAPAGATLTAVMAAASVVADVVASTATPAAPAAAATTNS